MRNFILLLVSFVSASGQLGANDGSLGEVRLECARSLLGQLKEPGDKADALVYMAQLFSQDGNKQAADKLLYEALNWATLISDGLSKAAAIGAIAKIGSLDHVERAAEIAKSLGGSHRAWASRQLITAYGRLGLADTASKLLYEEAKRIGSASTANETWYGDREYELAQLLTDSARAGLADQALRLGLPIKDKFVKGDVLRAAAATLAENHQPRRAIEIARSVYYEVERIDALVDVANAAARSGDTLSASQALSYALAETRKNIFDPEQDTKTRALVSIALAYKQNGQPERASGVLGQAEKVAYTIGKPGFKDSGLSQVALAYAQFGDSGKALQVTQEMSSPWSNTKSNTLASIASFMLDAGQREKAVAVLSQAAQVAKNIDCTYFKYEISVRSCYGDKAGYFLKIASAYQRGLFFEQEREALDLAALQNRYKQNPPQEMIADDHHIPADRPVGEQEIVEGYSAAGDFKKAIEVAGGMKDAKARVVAVATIEFKLIGSPTREKIFSSFGC
ncbi:MAG: tetratricopeptide repeat protein [Pyrinomonadaceae bacterium]